MSNYLIKTEKYRGHTINIYYDECYDYCDCEHLGTFYTNVPRELNPDDHKIDEILDENGRVLSDEYIYVIVYAYIHSGIALSCGRGYPFNDPWDSGTGGIMAVSKDKVRKEYGHKIVTKKDREKALDILKSEVEELNNYCQGCVYMYEIIDADGEPIEYCGGFVGDIDYCIDEAKYTIDNAIAMKSTEIFKAAMDVFEDCDGTLAVSDASKLFS